MAALGLTLPFVLSATSGALVRPGPALFTGVAIDGRAVPREGLFFAIRGERFDGHDFVAQAAASGASGLVVERGRGGVAANLPAIAVIEVDRPAAALGRLARAHRQSMADLRVVAITGSNGKTTTKEITASIFGAAVGDDAVLKTEGNLNNHFGVPLTLLRLTPAHRFAVVEMGMSALGEIASLAQLAMPDVGVVVNVAPVHLETLGSLAQIARAKGELYQALGPHGIAVVPIDEPLLMQYVKDRSPERCLTFGPLAAAPTVGIDQVVSNGREGIAFRLHVTGATPPTGIFATLPLLGVHNAKNAAAAVAAAHALGVGARAIVDGMARVVAAKHRGQLLTIAGRTVLDDCYNASPLSMAAALQALTALASPGSARVAVLGDMLELGPDSPRLHDELGRVAAEQIEQLIAFGPLAERTAIAARVRLGSDRVHHTEDPAQAAARVLEVSRPGDVVLIKASRGMRLERVIEALGASARDG